jgi:WXG100 family type VII secretion target
MTLISIDLNQARQTAGTFSSSGNTLDDVCAYLQQQWAALSSTWEGHSKHATEADVRAGLNQGRHCAEFTRERGAKLTQIADRFQATDENVAFPVAAIAWQAAGVASDGVVLGAATMAASAPILASMGIANPAQSWLTDLGNSIGSFFERVRNCLAGKDWKTDEELVAEEAGRQRQEAERLERQRRLDAAMPGARDTLDRDPNMTNMWRQVDAPLKNTAEQRSVEDYRAVIDQFDVENSHGGRYRPDDQHPDTRCNIFAGDALRAMDAPLPTKSEFLAFIDPNPDVDPKPAPDPMTVNAANAHTALDKGWGGWHHVDLNNPADLQTLHDYLQAGKPAVASDDGHIAVIRPDNLPEQLEVNNLKDLHIAQAGGYNYNDIALGDAGYGAAFNPDFYIHE